MEVSQTIKKHLQIAIFHLVTESDNELERIDLKAIPVKDSASDLTIILSGINSNGETMQFLPFQINVEGAQVKF